MSNVKQDDTALAIVSCFAVAGLIIYMLKKQDGSAFLMNYAKQGTILTIAAFIPVVNMIVFILSLVLVIKAAQGDVTYQLPVVGDLANKYL